MSQPQPVFPLPQYVHPSNGDIDAAYAPPLRHPGVELAARAGLSLHGPQAGRQIRQLRHGRGWTLKQLADQIGVTGTQLHRYETGSSRISAQRWAALMQALGFEPGEPVVSGAAASEDASGAYPRPLGVASDDLVSLVALFTRISDPKSRRAVIAIAQILATGELAG